MQSPLSNCLQNISQAFLCIVGHGAMRDAIMELEMQLCVHMISYQLSKGGGYESCICHNSISVKLERSF